MLFKTHPAHINQIKGAIKAFGPVYFHGDGNIYQVNKVNENGQMHDSDFRKQFHNPKNLAGSYRVKFDTIADVPNAVDEINSLLTRSKDMEISEANKPISETTNTFEAYVEDEPVKKKGK